MRSRFGVALITAFSLFGPVSAQGGWCDGLFKSWKRELAELLPKDERIDRLLLGNKKRWVQDYARSQMDGVWEDGPFREANFKILRWFGIKQEIDRVETANRPSASGGKYHVTAPAMMMTTPVPAVEKWADAVGLKDGDHLVGVGSGFGIVELWLGWTRPGVKTTGIEIQGERVDLAKNIASELELGNASFLQADLWKTPLPDGDVYYFYDPVPDDLRAHIIVELKEIARQRQKPIRIVAVSGWTRTIISDFDAEPWLKSTQSYTSWSGDGVVKIYSSDL